LCRRRTRTVGCSTPVFSRSCRTSVISCTSRLPPRSPPASPAGWRSATHAWGARHGAKLPLIAIPSAVPKSPVVEQWLRVARPSTRSPMIDRHITTSSRVMPSSCRSRFPAAHASSATMGCKRRVCTARSER